MEELGYDVLTACNGDDAINLHGSHDGKEALDFIGACDDLVDLVICDWKMPRLTGIELLRQVCTVDPDIPFLMLTGLADAESVATARESGVSAYCASPSHRISSRRASACSPNNWIDRRPAAWPARARQAASASSAGT